jgi:hypothetical protein
MYMLLPLIHSQSETVQKFSEQGIITLYSGELKQGYSFLLWKVVLHKTLATCKYKNNTNAGATGDFNLADNTAPTVEVLGPLLAAVEPLELIQLIFMLPRLRFWVRFWLRLSHWS